MFKANNKNIKISKQCNRKRSIVFIEHISHLLLKPIIVDFEQVNVSWEELLTRFQGAFFQNWVSITDGHRATCVITIKMQLGVQRASCNLHPCGVHERRLWKLSLFWGPNMLKQPVYDVLLGLISPQIPQIPCFLIFEEKYFKNSLQGWAFFTV